MDRRRFLKYAAVGVAVELEGLASSMNRNRCVSLGASTISYIRLPNLGVALCCLLRVKPRYLLN